MIKTILVQLNGDAADHAALETAYLLARPFNGHIVGLHISPSLALLAGQVAIQDVEAVLPSAEVFAALEQERKAKTWRSNRHFLEFCRHWQITNAASPGAPMVSAEMRERDGDLFDETIAEARFHDLIVLGRSYAGFGFGAILLGTGRPVVIAPKKAPENIGPTIAIAWKDTAEAARALTASMPLLSKANRIVILTAEEGPGRNAAEASAGRVLEYLRWHNFAAEIVTVDAHHKSVAEALMQSAENQHADLIVMGGYGHARLREFVLGGVTREVLTHCRLPVLLFH